MPQKSCTRLTLQDGCVRMAISRKIGTYCQTERDVNVTRKRAIFSSTECDVAWLTWFKYRIPYGYSYG